MGGYRRKFRHGSERAAVDGNQDTRESLETFGSSPPTPPPYKTISATFSCYARKQISEAAVEHEDFQRTTLPMSVTCDGTVASASAVTALLRSPTKGTNASRAKQSCSQPTNGSFMTVGDLSPYPVAQRSQYSSSPKPLYDVFLGGSCGNTVWRRDQVIPYLEKRAITYYDPQRSVWNEHMINEESVAKENSSLFLFVLDPATVNATSFLEIAHFAARKAPKLVVVFLGRTEWRSKGHPEDLPDRRRTCDLLDTILTLHSVPVLQSIQEALGYIDEVIIGEKTWSEALANPFQRFPYMMLKGRRAITESAKHVKTAWRAVRNGVVRWRGMKFLIIGACEALLVLMVHFFLRSLPFALVLLPLLAMDVLFAVCSLAYYRYKASVAAKRRAQLLQQRALSSRCPVPIPGSAVVPCDLRAQHIPLNCSCKVSNGISAREKNSISTQPMKMRSHESNGVMNPLRGMNQRSIDVFLGCSSRNACDLEWITCNAAPQLHKKGLIFSSELMVERHKRQFTLNSSRQILYRIPSSETMLSGMVEVAYFLGHTNWRVTLCVPKGARMFEVGVEADEERRKHIETRNECYRMAFCYLMDMAERRHCEVFPDVDSALQWVISRSKD